MKRNSIGDPWATRNMDADVASSFQDKVLKHPEAFFTPSDDLANEIKTFTKHVFDHCTQFVSKTSATPLDQLYIDGFDADQIWEQLRLQNEPLLEELSKRIRGFQKQPEQIRLFPAEKDAAEQEEDDSEADTADADSGAEQQSDSEAEEAMEVEEEEELNGEEEEEDEEEKKAKKKAAKKARKVKKARDVAEDGFFDWDEMDKMAEEEELDEDDEEEIDLNGDVDDVDGDNDDEDMDDDDDDDDDDDNDEEIMDDEEAANMKYDDFFDEANVKGDDDDEEEDDEEEDDEEDDQEEEEEDEFPGMNRQHDEPLDDVDEDDLAERGIMSSFQHQQHRLKKEISQLEEEALGEKHWLMKGEVRSGARPENSLLEAVLDYDRPGKVAPVITVEVSIALEDMIKKRILEDDFDDVIRKFAPNEEDEKKKLVDVSMEKSKEGLGDIYEKEYMKTAMGFEADDESKQDMEEIDVMFKSLCWKLDALSNYQFTPKPMVKELQVKPSVPAIAMEEVVPISVSDANLKAPEEIYEKKRKRGEAVLQSKEEMTQDERKAMRNAKKRVRRKEKQQAAADERLVAKINPGLGNKYEKKKMLESIANNKNISTGKEIDGSTKQFSNSKEFFSRLQEEVQGEIRKKAGKQ